MDMTQESEREGDTSVFAKVELGNGPDAAEPATSQTSQQSQQSRESRESGARRTLGNRSFLFPWYMAYGPRRAFLHWSTRSILLVYSILYTFTTTTTTTST